MFLDCFPFTQISMNMPINQGCVIDFGGQGHRELLTENLFWETLFPFNIYRQ